jgi:hypothetical protein
MAPVGLRSVKIPVTLFVLLASQIAAADMAERVAAGRSALNSTEGREYNTRIMGLVPQVMRNCAPPSATTGADWRLSLVGNISANGDIRDIEVEPANAVTNCLVEHFGKTKLPAPPGSSAGDKGFPMLVELMIRAGSRTAPDRTRTVMPVFGQLVTYFQPSSFVSAFQSSAAVNYIQEFVPQGESVEQWSQMITLTGAKDLALDPAATPRDFTGEIAARFSKACPGTFSSRVLTTTKISGHDALVALLGCGTVKSGTPRSEIALIIAIKGKSDMYTIQWAERGAPVKQPPMLDDSVWGPRYQLLNEVRVCNPAPGEPAPYVSCIGDSIR